MAERNAMKPRKCSKCQKTLMMNAKQIQEHARECDK